MRQHLGAVCRGAGGAEVVVLKWGCQGEDQGAI